MQLSQERVSIAKREQSLDRSWDRPLRDLLEVLQATSAGLTSEEAKRRLRLHGPNSLVRESRFAALFSFLHLFANPPVIILLVASTPSLSCWVTRSAA
jgi:magnesium-transporting ATPase (P-type)